MSTNRIGLLEDCTIAIRVRQVLYHLPTCNYYESLCYLKLFELTTVFTSSITVNNFSAGDLGPGTIVGSAAFNLFVIIGLCMYVIPSTEVRQVKHLGVFFVTATWSVLAYVWLYLIIAQISPGEVQVGCLYVACVLKLMLRGCLYYPISTTMMQNSAGTQASDMEVWRLKNRDFAFYIY